MADSWITALDERDARPEPVPEIKAVPTHDDEAERADAGPPIHEVKKTKGSDETGQQPRPKKTLVASGVVALALVGIVGASVITLNNSVNSSENESAPDAQAEAPVAVQADGEDEAMPGTSSADNEQVSIGTDCSEKTDSSVSGEDSPRSAVTAFENAYFSQDAQGVKKAVAKSSDLHKKDWEKVLKEAAPKGTAWCATMQPASGDSVNVDLKMALPDQGAKIYRQTVTATENNGQWLVSSISSRKD